MSIYNIVHGFNPSCIFFLPMLGRNDREYPRFRDCFLDDDDENHILIYTRVGGGNRNSGFGEEKLYDDPNFVETYDDPDDSTYGYYKFKIPDEWKEDAEKIINANFAEVSDKYVERCKEIFPKFAESSYIDIIFKRKKGEEESN